MINQCHVSPFQEFLVQPTIYIAPIRASFAFLLHPAMLRLPKSCLYGFNISQLHTHDLQSNLIMISGELERLHTIL